MSLPEEVVHFTSLLITLSLVDHPILGLFGEELTQLRYWKHDLFQLLIITDNLRNVCTCMIRTKLEISSWPVPNLWPFCPIVFPKLTLARHYVQAI